MARKESRKVLNEKRVTKLFRISNPFKKQIKEDALTVYQDVVITDVSRHGMGCLVPLGKDYPDVDDCVNEAGVKKYEVRWVKKPKDNHVRFGLKLISLKL